MRIKDLAQEAHKIADEKGWYETLPSFPEQIALIHSELSEALEEYRNPNNPTPAHKYTSKDGKPEGVPIELADAIIRILDYCVYWNIDIEEAITEKMRYNRTRPKRHGGKRV